MYSADLAGQVLDSLRFSSAIQLRFSDGWLTIETPFVFASPDGETYTLDPDPEMNPEPLGRLLAILHQPVVHADVDETSSTITVRFENGSSIVAGPDPEYESWELGRSNGDLLICGPGGL